MSLQVEKLEHNMAKLTIEVSAEELGKFCELFQIPIDELLYGKIASASTQMFIRKFNLLDETDQKEIINLIEFKRMMKERK